MTLVSDDISGEDEDDEEDEEKGFDDGEDIFEEVFNDSEDIFEEVFDDGEDIFEEVFDDGEDIFEEFKMVKELMRSDGWWRFACGDFSECTDIFPQIRRESAW